MKKTIELIKIQARNTSGRYPVPGPNQSQRYTDSTQSRCRRVKSS